MRVQYFEWDDRWLASLRAQAGLERLFHFLVVQQGGDVEAALEILRELARRGLLGPDADVDALEERLREEELVREVGGQLELTPRGERALRRDALEQIFAAGLEPRGAGDHNVPREGTGREPLPETRPWEFGDAPEHIDYHSSLANVLRRGADPAGLRESDLEVLGTEHQTACATVLLLDVSHSMVLYGEDRITPAKRVALALVELLRTRYPKDSLDLVLFGDEARHVPLDELTYVGAGPFHTNTRAGLQLARRILGRRKHANKQIVMITDGKPSAIHEEGVLYKNSFGLDPRIVNRTLDEAVVLRRLRIPITTFMLARDPHLQGFVQRLTELNHGRAYFASARDLEGYVLVDFLRNRRRRLR